LPVLGFRTLRAQGARITRRSWKLDMLVEDHRDALAPRTGHLHTHKVQREIILGKKRATVRPRTCKNVHALLRIRTLHRVLWLQGGCSAPRQSSTICQRLSITVRSTASRSPPLQ
jgi:hypothetical protein